MTQSLKRSSILMVAAFSSLIGLHSAGAQQQGVFSGLPVSTSQNPLFYREGAQAQHFEPLRVYVALDAGRRGQGRRGIDNRAEAILFDSLANSLPAGVQLVQWRGQADVILRVSERDLNVNFRTVDRDRKQRRYKGARRFDGDFAGRCGVPDRALYTKITERAVARYAFDVGIRFRGQGRDRLTLSGRAAVPYAYGTDLVALTRCGPQQTGAFPNRRVERLFLNGSPQGRRLAAKSARAQAYSDAGVRLSNLIGSVAHDYFAAQSAQQQGPRPGFDPRFDQRSFNTNNRGLVF